MTVKGTFKNGSRGFMNRVYINSFGAFLPGKPVSNKDMESYLGHVGGKSSRHRALVLKHNRIKHRHYAMDTNGAPQYSNAEMAAHAIRDAVQKSEVTLNDITYLATATSLGDMLLPGLASHIHAELKLPPIEIASFQSVCASALMAIKTAYLQVKSGEHRCAAVSGSEFASRYFRPGFYECTTAFQETGEVPLQADFLRFTLSDGAGAALLENKPNARQASLEIRWVDIRSYADRFETCMVGGGVLGKSGMRFWGDFESPVRAAEAGTYILMQDFDLMKRMLPVWVSHYLDLLDQGKIGDIDYFCSHYSSHSLREEAVVLLKKAGAMIPEEKWFSNLSDKGNTGAASIFIILEELYRQKQLKTGERILCHVPESGRGLNGFMMLEVA